MLRFAIRRSVFELQGHKHFFAYRQTDMITFYIIDLPLTYEHLILENSDRPRESSALSRHLHRINQNDSHPYPVQRPAVPTARDALGNLSSSTALKNLTLNYDIFEPAYSPTASYKVTKSSFDSFVESIKRSDSEKMFLNLPTDQADMLMHSKTAHPTDKQQFFLRHNINHKSDETPRSDLKNGLGEPISNERLKHAPQNTKRIHDDTEEARHVTKLHSNHQNNNIDDGPLTSRADKSAPPSVSKPRAHGSILNFQRHSKVIEEQAKSRTIQGTRKRGKKSAQKLSNFQLRSLSDVDSGSYTIQKMPSNKILVTLKSSTGELQSFYGASKPAGRQNAPVKKSQSHIGPGLPARLEPEHTNPIRKAGVAGTRPAKATSLRESKETPSLLNKKLMMEASGKRAPSLFNQNSTDKVDDKQTLEDANRQLNSYHKVSKSFDLYDESLAHVDKPVSYFTDPDSSYSSSPPKSFHENAKDSAFSIDDKHFAKVDKPVSYFANPDTQDHISNSPAKSYHKSSKDSAFDIYDKNFAKVDKPVSYFANPDRTSNNKPAQYYHKSTKESSLDNYDSRFAKVDKPVVYFAKSPSVDRLIITENSDPVTDSSMVKLFVNPGTEDAMLPETRGLERHEMGLHLRHVVRKAVTPFGKHRNARKAARGFRRSSSKNEEQGHTETTAENSNSSKLSAKKGT